MTTRHFSALVLALLCAVVVGAQIARFVYGLGAPLLTGLSIIACLVTVGVCVVVVDGGG